MFNKMQAPTLGKIKPFINWQWVLTRDKLSEKSLVAFVVAFALSVGFKFLSLAAELPSQILHSLTMLLTSKQFSP